MVIKKIVLHKFKRFALKGIDHYELIPSSKLIILNWSNGVGKSSLLSQLNPLPAELKRDFYPDGYKEIHIEHNNKLYVITSKDTKHSILEDNKELNPSGNKRTLIQIVQDIFNINTNKLDVINGINLFTNMSPSERKSWLTSISTVDYRYPISVYSKLLDRKKDLIAYKKLQQEKLTEANSTLNKYSNIEELKKKEEVYKYTMDNLLKEYNNITNINIEVIENNLKSLNKAISNHRLYKENKTIYIKDIETNIIRKETTLKLLLEESSNITKQIDLIHQDMVNVDKEVIDTTLKLINSMDKDILQFILNSNREITISRLTKAVNTIDNLKVVLTKITQEVDIQEDYKLEQDRLSKTIATLEVKLKEMMQEIEDSKTLSTLNNVRCNHCGNKVTVDLSKLNYKSVDSIKDEITTLKEQYRVIVNKIKLIDNYNLYKEKILSFVNGEFKCYFKEIDITKDIFMVLKDINNTLVYYIHYLEESSDYIDLYLQYKDKLQDYNSIHTEKFKKKQELEEKYKKIIEDTYKLREEISTLTKDKKEYENFVSIRNNIRSELKKYNTYVKERTKVKINEWIDLNVKNIEQELALIDRDLKQYELIQNNIDTYVKDIKTYEEELIVLEDLLNILSPTKGLIAKSINSFLGVFIKEMNSIINTVWDYNLEILPCDISSETKNDLDYKFKVIVNNNIEVEDVSRLSSSMQEIVNLAFRIVFIKYSKIPNLPLLLDEFGRTMDREHRINSFNMLDNILLHSFEQIFLVSHFEEIYGRFNLAQFPMMEKEKEIQEDN